MKEEEVAILMKEFKSSGSDSDSTDQSDSEESYSDSDSEERTEDKEIANEESPKFFDLNNLSDEQRVVGTSIVLFLVLFIFPTLKISSNENAVLFGFLPVVFIIQVNILRAALKHPANTGIFGIIFILLMSSAISFMGMAIVSWTAAYYVLGFWGVIIASVVIANREVIFNEDIVFSKGIQKCIVVVSVLFLVCTIKCMVYK